MKLDSRHQATKPVTSPDEVAAAGRIKVYGHLVGAADNKGFFPLNYTAPETLIFLDEWPMMTTHFIELHLVT